MFDLGEYHSFVQTNASQSTKWLYFLKFWGVQLPMATPMGPCLEGHCLDYITENKTIAKKTLFVTSWITLKEVPL